MALKRGLGKGLDSMIPNREKNPQTEKASSFEKDNSDSTDQAQKSSADLVKPYVSQKEEFLNPELNQNAENQDGRERMIRLSMIEPNRSQPRKNFEEDALAELADSIRQYGVLQPLLVKDQGTYYEIIAGERRWRAAKIAGLKEIPVIVCNYSDLEIVEISLIENIQRENLNPVEEARAFKRLLEEFDLKQDELAERVSKSRTTVTNSLRLLKLDERVLEMLEEDMISAGHARALLSIDEKEKQYTLAVRIFDENLSVRETEKLVKKITESPGKRLTGSTSSKNVTEDAVFESLQEKMKEIMGTKVLIQRKRNNKGKIEIEYYSMEELDRIISLIESIKS